jgi:hypothetical protein
MSIVLGFLAVIGGACVLVLFVAFAIKIGSWWNEREMRRWPTVYQWHALDRALLTVHRTDPARVAYRKLRYKYARKTGE